MRCQAQKLRPRRDLKTFFLSEETIGFFRQMTLRGLIFPFLSFLKATVFKKNYRNKAKSKISIYVAEVIKMS